MVSYGKILLSLGSHVTCQILEITMSHVTKSKNGVVHVTKVPMSHVNFQRCPWHSVKSKKQLCRLVKFSGLDPIMTVADTRFQKGVDPLMI